MHDPAHDDWRHHHQFFEVNASGERGTWMVIALTVVTMLAEIAAGTVYGSMALLADGWHMGTHALALGITAAAYHFSRRHEHDARFSFGTGKIGILGGFTSAVFLGLVAVGMAVESALRLLRPEEIHFDEAILVAGLGLAVNLFSAWLLRDGHGSGGHDQGHDHGGHSHGHHDHNLQAAYLHVAADALTSVLAIVALLAGKYRGWNWLDPAMGIAGAAVILRWAHGLMKETARILLDCSVHPDFLSGMRAAVESDGDSHLTDIHVWEVGGGRYAAIMVVVTHAPRDSDHYRQRLAGFHEVAHLTVEVRICQSEGCLAVPDNPVVRRTPFL